MLAHIAGFAAISAGSELVRPEGAAAAPRVWEVVMFVPVMALVMLALCHVSRRVRLFISAYDEKVELSEKMWDTVATEAEEDVMSMAVSFMSVSALQFALLGVLPDRHGSIQAELPPWQWRFDTVCMLATGGAASAITLTLVLLSQTLQSERTIVGRLLLLAQNYASECFAWSVLFAVKALVKWRYHADAADGVTARVITALGVSAFACINILPLDKLADSIGQGAPTQQAIVKVILSLGVLVGFAWELCFSAAIEVIGERVRGPSNMLCLGLSLVMGALVVPAYLLHIAPIIEAHRQQAVRAVPSRRSGRASSVVLRSHFSRSFSTESPHVGFVEHPQLLQAKSSPSVLSHYSMSQESLAGSDRFAAAVLPRLPHSGPGSAAHVAEDFEGNSVQ